jgi:hypothetical protein
MDFVKISNYTIEIYFAPFYFGQRLYIPIAKNKVHFLFQTSNEESCIYGFVYLSNQGISQVNGHCIFETLLSGILIIDILFFISDLKGFSFSFVIEITFKMFLFIAYCLVLNYLCAVVMDPPRTNLTL